MVKKAMDKRPFNFGAGPSMLPEAILSQAQAELMDWQGTGMSVMETGHRTDRVELMMENAEQDLRALLSVPDNYRILFIGCAARMQFAMVPMNLLGDKQSGAYLISGIWSSQAYKEADKISRAYIAGSNEQNSYTDLPGYNCSLQPDTAYFFYTPNETINGIRTPLPPRLSSVPVVADMTSCLLTEPLNVSDYGLIFAGAQKNISIPGLTIVIIRDDLLEKKDEKIIPTSLDYRTYAAYKSLYSTPPVFNCYLAGKMFQWVKACGGVDALYKINRTKADILYQYIDSSDFYQCHIGKNARSLVNVCFQLTNPNLENRFIRQAEANGLKALKGHRVVGGLRASLYNAMPVEGVYALIEFMKAFSREN